MSEEQKSFSNPSQEVQKPSVRYAESLIFEDQEGNLSATRHAVAALNESGLTNLSIVSRAMPTEPSKERFLIKNNVGIFAGPVNKGFGPIWAVEYIVRSSIVKGKEGEALETSDDLVQKVIDDRIVDSVSMQVADFQRNPSVYNAFIHCLEEDSLDAAHELIETLRRPNDMHIINLVRFPAIAEYLINAHEDYPEFIDTIFHSTSILAHLGMYGELLSKFAALGYKRPHRLVLDYLASTYIDPLLHAASDSQDHVSNPYARWNTYYLYKDLFEEKGILTAKKLPFDHVRGFLEEVQSKILRTSMHSKHQNLRETAKEYFMKNIHTLNAQLLLMSTIGESVKRGEKKDQQVKPFIVLAFERGTVTAESLYAFYAETGVDSDFNRALGGMIFDLYESQKRGELDQDTALIVTLRCLDFFVPLTQPDIDILQRLQATQSLPSVIKSRVVSLLESIK